MKSAARRRLRECVERWPECESGAYDPRCCRFPKSCSCTSWPSNWSEVDLEPLPESSAAKLLSEELIEERREEQRRENEQDAASTERELRVTTTLRWPMSKMIETYADAISPDGGYTGTLDAWIEEWAEGVARDMERAGLDATPESSWRLAEAGE